MAKAKGEGVTLPESIGNEAETLINDPIEQAAEVTIKAEAAPVHNFFEEWKVEINGKKVEKLKMVRPCVKITDEQAEVLNIGVRDGGNQIALMYFKPE